jgi:hypothetical protein
MEHVQPKSERCLDGDDIWIRVPIQLMHIHNCSCIFKLLLAIQRGRYLSKVTPASVKRQFCVARGELFIGNQTAWSEGIFGYCDSGVDFQNSQQLMSDLE